MGRRRRGRVPIGEVIELINNGSALVDIAGAYGVSREYVRQIMVANNLCRRCPGCLTPINQYQRICDDCKQRELQEARAARSMPRPCYYCGKLIESPAPWQKSHRKCAEDHHRQEVYGIMLAKQKRSLLTATRSNIPWTPEEDAELFNGPALDVALRLHRTFSSVQNRRQLFYKLGKAPVRAV